MHTVDGCLYLECVCMCVHACLTKNQNAPRPSEHPPVLLLLLLFLTFSVLVADPKKTTLHGGQSRSWSTEQGVSTFKSVRVLYTGTVVLRLSSTILGAGDDLLSSAARKPRYVQLKRLR